MKNKIKKFIKKRNESIDKKIKITKKIKKIIKNKINKQEKILEINVNGKYSTTIFIQPYIYDEDLKDLKKEMENLGLNLISLYVPAEQHSIYNKITFDSCIALTFSAKFTGKKNYIRN